MSGLTETVSRASFEGGMMAVNHQLLSSVEINDMIRAPWKRRLVRYPFMLGGCFCS